MLTKPKNFNETYIGVSSNKIKMNEPELPFNVSYIKILAGFQTRLHNHHDWEYLTIISGEGKIKIDSNIYPLSAGDIFYIKPFQSHLVINASSTKELIFTATWGYLPKLTEKYLQYTFVDENLIPENTIIINSFPTPNGPLHLGHLAGPYIASDIYARFLKQQGKSVFPICGLDQNHTWCSGESFTNSPLYSNQIKNTLENSKLEYDLFLEPSKNSELKNLTQEIFSKLYLSSILISKTVKVFVCEKTGRFLADCEIIGSCYFCAEEIRGNICEKCFAYVSDDKIVNPRAFDPNITLTTVTKVRIFFPLNNHREILRRFIFNSKLNSDLKRICIELLKRPLPDIPVSQFYSWGYEVNINEYSDQFIASYFEHISRLIYTFNIKNEKIDFKDDEIMRFFGIDNLFMYAFFSPALINAFDAKLFNKLASNSNQYYLLDNKKFSTSRGHAIWADQFIKDHGSDLTRFYLTYARPENFAQNHVESELKLLSDLCSEYKVGFDKLIYDIKLLFNGIIPEPGCWDLYQKNYYVSLKQSVQKAFSFFLTDNFSMREYSCVLLDIFASIKNLEKKYEFFNSSEELNAYYRTFISLQASSAHLISILSWPVIPDFACHIYKSLGFEGLPIIKWSSQPELLNNHRINPNN